MSALALDAAAIAEQFPALRREGLVYLDSAVTSQKPQVVIDAMSDHLTHHYGSVHRGVYPLAVESTERFEGGRAKGAAFVGSSPRETVILQNATYAVNLVAQSWGRANVQAGDRVVVTAMEHHAVIVPWQQLCLERGAHLDVVPIDDDGLLVLDALDELLARGPKLVAVTHASNVLGTVNPIEEVARRVHAAGALLLVDGTQAVPQMPVDVAALGADFYVWTAHKAYGPTGIGLLHARRDVLEGMPPWAFGGNMISSVSFEKGTRFAEVPGRFEPGTSPIVEATGMAAALDFLGDLGMEAVRGHAREVTAYALEQLADVPGLTVFGPPDADRRAGIVSFALDHAHPHDIADILGRRGVCVRAGHHCAQPLMRRLGVGATTRASFAVHSTHDDVDRLVEGLAEVARIFGD
jgi:cysteine desulfurase/selenocysteine lyase